MAVPSRINWRGKKRIGECRKLHGKQNKNLELANLNIQPRLAADYAEDGWAQYAFVCVCARVHVRGLHRAHRRSSLLPKVTYNFQTARELDHSFGV